MTDIDLFGLAAGPVLTEKQRRKLRKSAQARGYAAVPGSGPVGETCKSCKHLVRKSMAKTYLKCGLMRAHWTGGGGTDVRAASPACRNWERPNE
jgi:hypothetical protein